MPLRAVALLAEVELSDELDDRTRRRLGERARSRMRRAVERQGAAVVELPPAAIVGLWTDAPERDAERALRAAHELLASLRPLGDAVSVRGAVDVVEASGAGSLVGAGLAALADLHAEAPDGEISVGDAVDDLLPKPEVPPAPAPPEPDPGPQSEGSGPVAPPPEVLPELGDQRIAALFNARAWDALAAAFAPDWHQVDHRGHRAEDGWTATAFVASYRALAEDSPDARAVVQRRAAAGGVGLGVFRISGNRRGRPFEMAQTLLTVMDDSRIQASEVFAIGDRAAARERFDALTAALGITEAPQPTPAPPKPRGTSWLPQR